MVWYNERSIKAAEKRRGWTMVGGVETSRKPPFCSRRAVSVFHLPLYQVVPPWDTIDPPRGGGNSDANIAEQEFAIRVCLLPLLVSVRRVVPWNPRLRHSHLFLRPFVDNCQVARYSSLFSRSVEPIRDSNRDSNRRPSIFGDLSSCRQFAIRDIVEMWKRRKEKREKGMWWRYSGEVWWRWEGYNNRRIEREREREREKKAMIIDRGIDSIRSLNQMDYDKFTSRENCSDYRAIITTEERSSDKHDSIPVFHWY